MKFGEKLRERRTELGFTQQDVAKRIGITRRAYISYEQDNVRPRKRETYKKLADVLDCDADYLMTDGGIDSRTFVSIASSILGLSLAVMSALVAPTSLPATVTLPYSRMGRDDDGETEVLTKTNDLLLQYAKKQRKFQKMALGEIMSLLADKGIGCMPGSFKGTDSLGGRADAYIVLEGHRIETWWFAFWADDEELRKREYVFTRDRAHLLFSRFSTAAADPRRKASIVVDNRELFDELCRFKGHNSYRGNMSAILIEPDEAKVVKEEMLAFFDAEAEADGMKELRLSL